MQPLTHVTLDTLAPGATGIVLRVDGGDAIAERLEALGFWTGTPVSVARCAPFGDPVEYRLRGFRLALRRVEAARVLVTAGT